MKVLSHGKSIVAVTALLACAASMLPAAEDPRVLLERSVNEVLSIVYEQPANGQPMSARVRPTLERAFDFEATTRSAVGPGWRQFTAEEKTRTIQLFSDLVLRTYADRFEPGPRPTIAYGKSVFPADKRCEIPTTITYEGTNYAVSYKFRESADGWRIYDVIIENVSMVANYRAQFDDLFKKGGAAAVLKSLEDNLSQVSEENAR